MFGRLFHSATFLLLKKCLPKLWIVAIRPVDLEANWPAAWVNIESA